MFSTSLFLCILSGKSVREYFYNYLRCSYLYGYNPISIHPKLTRVQKCAKDPTFSSGVVETLNGLLHRQR